MKKIHATTAVRKIVTVDVLVLEDQPEVRQSLVELLEAASFVVASAPNGAEAVKVIDGGLRPRVILLDLNMPVMDGWAFLRERRSHAVLRRTPVAVISGEETDARVRSQVDACLPKPVDVEPLLDLLCRHSGLVDAELI